MAEIPFIVTCTKHNRTLEVTSVTTGRREMVVEVEPCDQCTDEAYNRGCDETEKTLQGGNE
jgi:deoxycytidylate deaminase